MMFFKGIYLIFNKKTSLFLGESENCCTFTTN